MDTNICVFLKTYMMCFWLLTACIGLAPVQPNYLSTSIFSRIPSPIVSPSGIGPITTTTLFPTFPPTTVRPNTPFPSIDPRGTSPATAPLKLTDAELLRPSGPNGLDYRDVVIETNQPSSISFPRTKRSVNIISNDHSRYKRQSNCGCVFPVFCPNTTTTTTTPNYGTGLIDFRVVSGGDPSTTTTTTTTTTASPQTCASGLIYCCFSPIPQTSCGSRFVSSINYPIQSGQAKYGDYPWMVIILTNDNQYVGGGVLIDLQHVLTTAHRIANYPNGIGLKVRLGEWDVTAAYEQYPYRDYSITRVFTHESYNPNTLQNDVSLIRIAGGSISTTPAILPVCMPTTGQIFDGQRCWVSGWGKDSFSTTGQYQTILKAVDVPVLSSVSCESSLRNTRLGTAFVLDRAAFICAGGEVNKDACTGDGGSGLVCETSTGRWTLAGLVAWGIGCATQGVPAAYVNVVNYLPWITSKQSSA